MTRYFISEAAFATAVGLPPGSIWKLVQIGRVEGPGCSSGYLFSHDQARLLCRECFLDAAVRADVECIAGRTTYLVPQWVPTKFDNDPEIEQDYSPSNTEQETDRGQAMENNGTGREDREVILGSAPSVVPAFATRSVSSPTTHAGLDLTEYLDELADADSSEAWKLEFLAVVASMMAACVHLGVDVGICGQLLDAFNRSSTATPEKLESRIQQTGKASSDLQKRRNR